jgi:hypothetical protein
VPFPLEKFGVDELRTCSEELRALPAADSVAAEGQLLCEYLYRALVDGEGRPACPLVRLYKTQGYSELEPELQLFARSLLVDGVEHAGELRCLTLLGTAGDEPAWNDRSRSVGHQAIPLPSEEFVERLPMVAQLIRQLGLDLGVVVAPPSGRDAVALSQRLNDVFHVREAAGSPFLPAQDFVAEHEIASAVGFGGVFVSGAFFSVVLFSRVPIDDALARTLKILAQPIRIRFLPHLHAVRARR